MSSETITIYLNTTANAQGINAVVSGIGKVEDAAKSLDSYLKRTITSLAGMAAGVFGINAIANGLKNAVMEGVRFNATVEDARLGVAAILKQFNPQLFRTFAEAMKASGDAIELLKKKAVESPASFKELVAGFQAISGAASGARIAVKDQVDLIVIMSQALAGLGIRSEQLIQESRALITGNINQNAAAAKILGITKAQIDAARASGTVFEFLRDKLSAFAEAGRIGATNFTTAISNLGDTVQQKLGLITVPIFEAMKGGVLELTAEINKADLAKSFESIASKIAGVTSAILDLARFGVRNINLMTTAVEALSLALGLLAIRATAAIVPFVTRFTGPILASFMAINTVVAQVSKYSGALAGIVASLSTWAGRIGIVFAGFAGFKAGQFLNELDLLGDGLGSFGIKVKDLVTYNILRAMEAWERFKLSLGIGGSESMLKGIQQSIQDVLAPVTRTPPKAGAGPSEPPQTAKVVDEITQQRMLVEQNALRITSIQNDIGISTRERNQSLREALTERLTLVTELQKKISDQVKTMTVSEVDENGKVIIRFTEEYSEKSKELNATLEEQLRIKNELFSLEDKGFLETFSNSLHRMLEETENVGAAMANVFTNGIGDAVRSVSDGIWDVIDGTATWGDIAISVGRRVISSMLEIVIVQGVVRAAMNATAAIAELLGAKQVAQSMRAFTASAIAGAGKSGEQGGWVGLLIYMGVLAATIASITAMTGGFEKGGVVPGGEQFIRVNESGTESVLNARATSMLGVDAINRLNSGVDVFGLQNRVAAFIEPPSSSEQFDSGAGPSMQSAAQVQSSDGKTIMLKVIVVANSKEAFDEYVRGGGIDTRVIDVSRDNAVEIGIRS